MYISSSHFPKKHACHVVSISIMHQRHQLGDIFISTLLTFPRIPFYVTWWFLWWYAFYIQPAQAQHIHRINQDIFFPFFPYYPSRLYSSSVYLGNVDVLQNYSFMVAAVVVWWSEERNSRIMCLYGILTLVLLLPNKILLCFCNIYFKKDLLVFFITSSSSSFPSHSHSLHPYPSIHRKKNSYTLHTTPHILYFYRYVLRACVCSSAPTFPSNKLVK